MPKQNILEEIVQKVVEEAVPEKIILFGSRAKGERLRYLCLEKRHPPLETPERFNELKSNPFLIYCDIAKYGRVVYEK